MLYLHIYYLHHIEKQCRLRRLVKEQIPTSPKKCSQKLSIIEGYNNSYKSMDVLKLKKRLNNVRAPLKSAANWKKTINNVTEW